MEIQCSQFKIRTWKHSDAPSLALYANNPNIAKQLPDAFPQPYQLKDAEGYINFCLENYPKSLLAIDVDDQAVGTIGFKDVQAGENELIEMGYWLGEPFWGQGIITEAIGKLLQYGRDHLQIRQVKAFVFDGNEASKRALVKNGFELIGIDKESEMKAGRAIDQYVYKKSSLI